MTYKDINAMILVFLTYGAAIAVALMIFKAAPVRTATATNAVATSTQTVAAHQVVSLSNDPGALFSCSSNMSLKADFVSHEVHLVLSDGRRISVPQVVSADGGRYANPDQSFVFWNKGTSAFVQEYGNTTYADCLTTP